MIKAPIPTENNKVTTQNVTKGKSIKHAFECPYLLSRILAAERKSNFFSSPPAHLCEVKYDWNVVDHDVKHQINSVQHPLQSWFFNKKNRDCRPVIRFTDQLNATVTPRNLTDSNYSTSSTMFVLSSRSQNKYGRHDPWSA